MEQPSFFGQLLHRRIPQILGMYVAATWMSVEMGEWMTGRFGLPDTVTSYIFIGMIALAPSVVVLAWGHGAPGKDRWTLLQGVFLPLNLVFAIAAMVYLVESPPEPAPPAEPVAIVETREFTNELGEKVTYEVAREGFHQRLFSFFWRNETGDPELDWMSYGVPWLLTEDVKRTPLVSASTPFDSGRIVDRLRSLNFDQALGEPLSLDLQIARTRGLKHIITGELISTENGIALTARVHKVDSGDLIGEWTEGGDDILESIDRLSGSIADALLETSETNTVVTQLSVKEHTSDSLPAIEKMIEALRKRAFDNEYPAAIQATREALEIDPSFAQAHVEAMIMYRALGDLPQALAEAQKALALDYKLYSELKFAVKATTYALQFQTDKVLRVLEMWRDVHPDSVEVHQLLANNYLALGSRVEDAQLSFKRVLELDPSNEKILLNVAATYRLLDDPQRALEIINQYIQTNPEDASAHESLGQTLVQARDLAGARQAFEELAFLDTNNPIAELNLARLMIRAGDFDLAQRSLSGMLSQDLTDRQRFEVLTQLMSLQTRLGQIHNALDTTAEMDALATRFLPPVSRVLQLGLQRISYLAMIGKRESAITGLEQMRNELQPPLDGLVMFAELNLYRELDERQAYRDTHARLAGFFEKNPFPGVILDLLRNYTVIITRWDGEYEKSLSVFDELLISYRRSFVSLQTPEVMEETRLEKAITLRLAGRLEEAAEIFEDLLSLSPANPRALLELARVRIDQEQLPQAREALQALQAIYAHADPDFSNFKQFNDLMTRVGSE